MAHQLSKGHISGFMSWRFMHSPNGKQRDIPVSARTVNKDRAVLSALFSFGEGQEIIDTNPVPKTKERKGDKRKRVILDQDSKREVQFEALLRECRHSPMLHTYVLVLGETGMRCDSEALWLQWEDLDFEVGLITVDTGQDGEQEGERHRTKSGKRRKVPMTPRLRLALREHMARYRMRTYHGRRSRWVFHHELDRRHGKAGSRLRGLRRAFNSAAERAGLPPGFRQHDLRHRRVTRWLAEGKSPALVQVAMGHANIKTTKDYFEHTAHQLLALVEPPTEAMRELAES